MEMGFKNPFETQTEKGFMEKVISPARARIIAGLLMVASPSVEACTVTVKFGEGALTAIDKQERPDAPELPNYSAMIGQLKAVMGEDLLAAEIGMHEAYVERARGGRTVKLKNFEEMDFEEKEMRNFLSLYPRSWLSNVSNISINPHFSPIQHPGLEGKPEFGHCQRSWTGEPITIEFTSESLKRSDKASDYTKKMFDSFTHELSHGASWSSNAKISTKQSLSMMYMAWMASSDPERPKFEYPESIKAKPGQEKDAAYAKMTEYFAELMEVVFEPGEGDSWETWKPIFIKKLRRHEATPQAAEQNYKMIRYFFAWSEPGYKIWEAGTNINQQVQILEQMHAYRRFIRALSKLQEDALSSGLKDMLNDTSVKPEDVEHQYKKIEELVKQDSDEIRKREAVKDDNEAVRRFNPILFGAMTIRNLKANTPASSMRAMYGVYPPEDTKYFLSTYNKLSPEQKEKVRLILLERLKIVTEKAS
ncbi:MAG: hypothetical protein WCW31_03310 [Patescibacteria group bacterium]